jgi:hypothetical protein
LYAWQTLEEGIGGAVVVLGKIGDAGRTSLMIMILYSCECGRRNIFVNFQV